MSDFEDRAMYYLNQTRREVKPKTTCRRLTSMRNFAKWAGYLVLEDYEAPTPGKSMPHPIPEGIAGIERMIELGLNAEQRAMVGLCGFAGLRIHEALDCETGWFDLNNMLLTVQGKGSKERIIPVSKRCWSAVSTAFVDAMAVTMLDPKVKSVKLVNYGDRSARKAITSLGRKAGLSRSIASHDLRATFATHVYDLTKDQRVVQELLGHANGATTEVYIAVTNDKMRKAVEF